MGTILETTEMIGMVEYGHRVMSLKQGGATVIIFKVLRYPRRAGYSRPAGSTDLRRQRWQK